MQPLYDVTETEDVRDVRHELSMEQLERLGVRKLNRYSLALQCNICETVWSPQLMADSSLPRGFWRCPNRCNW
jgi:hypothetical protein